MEIQFFFKFVIFLLFNFIFYHPHHCCNLQGYWFCSKVVWDIDTKFSPVVVLMSFQLSTKFKGHNSLKKTAMPLGSSKWKWAWRAHFLSHTYETQEICCFLADVKIILLSFFDLSYCLKVAKNAEAFLSRCSELFGSYEPKWLLNGKPLQVIWLILPNFKGSDHNLEVKNIFEICIFSSN